jgi:hypothetical protein
VGEAMNRRFVPYVARRRLELHTGMGRDKHLEASGFGQEV